jgi:lipopolysaccharide transport system permease protein
LRVGAELSRAADYCRRVFRLRYFWLALVRTDLRNRYRRSFLGIAWSLGRPLGMTVVLSAVFTNAFNLSVREYAPFLFLGIALWQFLVESMVAGCQAFKLGATYIRQQPLPLAIFPLRTVLGAAAHTGLALAVAVLLTACCLGLPPAPVLLSAVPGLVILFLLGLALATLLGILHTHYPDTRHLLDITLQALFYLTPVMYRPDTFADRNRLAWLITWNPLTAVLELVRRPLLAGQYPEPAHLLQAAALLLVAGTLAWACLRHFERDLVYWI